MIDVPLELTQALLDTGDEGCPVSRAAQAAIPGAMVTVSLGHGRLWIDAPGLHAAVDLPWDVRNIINALSHGYAVTPRTLTLPIPREIASIPGLLADETLLAPPELEHMPL